MIIRELTEKEARQMLTEHGLRDTLPYRGYATTLSDDGKRRIFIGHSPERKYLLQLLPSENSTP
jgi:hypothetical protein